MLSNLKDQFGVVTLVFVLLVLLGFLWIFRSDHDTILSINNWIAGVIGGILSLVTGKIAHATQQNNISNSSVQPVVENETKE